jgi:hypothetical protein
MNKPENRFVHVIRRHCRTECHRARICFGCVFSDWRPRTRRLFLARQIDAARRTRAADK